MVRIRQILANFPGNYTNLDTFLTKNYLKKTKKNKTKTKTTKKTLENFDEML